MKIERYAPDSAIAQQLLAARCTELRAFDLDRPVGCAGLRILSEDVAELKRMYGVPEARKRGVAQLLLQAMDQVAQRLGVRTLVLETGARQEDAFCMERTIRPSAEATP